MNEAVTKISIFNKIQDSIKKNYKLAISIIVITSGVSAGVLINALVVRLVVIGVGLAGVLYILKRVPTREKVLEQRNL